MFYIVCVVYNKTIQEIASIKQFEHMLKRHNDVVLLILDNSTKQDVKIANEKHQCIAGSHYISNEDNLGLSRAYNKALEIIDINDWIMWTDDDTEFSGEYLNNAYSSAVSSSYDIISGIIKTKVNTVLSPTSRKSMEISLTPNVLYKDMYFINSGLCIRRKIYNEIGKYDERLFIDMIDYWLFDELKKKQLDSVFVVKGSITQDFSGNNNASIKSQMKRFKIYYKDFKAYCAIEKRNIWFRIKIPVKRILKIIYTGICRG